MPTTKPRVWVTLEPEAYEVLEGMARLGNTTPGRVLSEIAAPVLPALKRLVEASEEFAAWERSLKGQLAEVQREVGEGVETAVKALEARRKAFEGAGGSPGSSPPSGALVAPASPAGGTGPGTASIPRSASPGPVPEASGKARLTPPTNRGVIRTRHKGNQRLSKGGAGRGI